MSDIRYLESKFPDVVAAGEPFTITHFFRNEGEPGDGKVEMTADGEEITKTFTLAKGESYSLTESLTMPYADSIRLYGGNVFSAVPQIPDGWAALAQGLQRYDWVKDGSCLSLAMFRKGKLDAATLYQCMRENWGCVTGLGYRPPDEFHEIYDHQMRDIFGLYEPYYIGRKWTSYKYGAPWMQYRIVAKARPEVCSLCNWQLTRFWLAPLWILSGPHSHTWVNLDHVISSLKNWVKGDLSFEMVNVWEISDNVDFVARTLAGFPRAILEPVTAPKFIRPGTEFSFDLLVRNAGYRGDIGLLVRDNITGEEVSRSERVDPGGIVGMTYTGEMPAVPRLQIQVLPIHLGRGKTWNEGEGAQVVEISATDALLHGEKVVEVLGDNTTVTGFVAGKNIRVRGLGVTPGVGGPLGGIIPYGGYVLSGDLHLGDVATIEFEELYFLRVDTTKEIATARLGSLIERATKAYEYSQVPTPSMTLHSLKSVGNLLTKPAPRLEVR